MKKILFLFALTFLTLQLNARHILSSSMRYNCINEGTYEIELEMYRDCFAGGAEFDQEIEIGIYKSETYLLSISVDLTSVDQVIYDGYEDCEPDADMLCVEKGIYKFNVLLPILNEEYQLVYQRCCWADDILNILNPGDTGISALTNISAEAQQICNKQVALNFPLAFTSCPDVPVEITFPIVDEEGDTYEYQICLPYEGGGSLGSADNPGDPTSCEGLTPSHPCPPLYSTVTLADGFDEDNIFPTLDGISLDNDTGTLSFTPTTQGRYIYSLCFTEYRNGEVIGLGQSILQLSNRFAGVNSTSEAMDNSWSVGYYGSASQLKIELEDFKETVLHIYDIEGRLIKQATIDESKVLISTIGFTSGTYLVQISQAGIISTKRVAVY